MAEPGGGALGGGNVAAYAFDEDGGPTVTDSSGHGNHGTVVVNEEAGIPFTEVTIELGDEYGTFPLYLVFPEDEARINWLEFIRPPGFGGPNGPPWAPRPPP